MDIRTIKDIYQNANGSAPFYCTNTVLHFLTFPPNSKPKSPSILTNLSYPNLMMMHTSVLILTLQERTFFWQLRPRDYIADFGLTDKVGNFISD